MKRDRNIVLAYRREVDMRSKRVESAKRYSRKIKHKKKTEWSY